MKVKVTQSCPTLYDPMDYTVHWMNSSGQNTGVGSLPLLQGIFPTQGSSPDLLHCRWILYQLSHQGNPKIPEWVAYPFSKDLTDPTIKPGSPALQVDSLPAEITGKPCQGPAPVGPGWFEGEMDRRGKNLFINMIRLGRNSIVGKLSGKKRLNNLVYVESQ